MLIREFITKWAGSAVMSWLVIGMAMMGCSGDLNPLNAPANDNSFSVLELGDVDDPGIVTKPLVSKQEISAAEGGEIVMTGTVRVKAEKFAVTRAEKKQARGQKVTMKYEYRISVPAGALDEDTEIQMRVRKRNAMLVQLNPHGIQFKKPVKLTVTVSSDQLKLRDINPGVDIFWLNENDNNGNGKDGLWVPLNAFVVTEDGKLEATVNLEHFSQYSLGGYGPIQKAYFQNWYYSY